MGLYTLSMTATKQAQTSNNNNKENLENDERFPLILKFQKRFLFYYTKGDILTSNITLRTVFSCFSFEYYL